MDGPQDFPVLIFATAFELIIQIEKVSYNLTHTLYQLRCLNTWVLNKRSKASYNFIESKVCIANQCEHYL